MQSNTHKEGRCLCKAGLPTSIHLMGLCLRHVRDVLDTAEINHHRAWNRRAVLSSSRRNTWRFYHRNAVPTGTRSHRRSAIYCVTTGDFPPIGTVCRWDPANQIFLQSILKLLSSFASTFWRKSELTDRKANHIVNTQIFFHSVHGVRAIWEVYTFKFGPCPLFNRKGFIHPRRGLDLLWNWG